MNGNLIQNANDFSLMFTSNFTQSKVVTMENFHANILLVVIHDNALCDKFKGSGYEC